jgi:large subunit ribosomal protein L2
VRDDFCVVACGASDASASARLKLDVVDKGTGRELSKRKAVTYLDRRVLGDDERITDLEVLRSEHVETVEYDPYRTGFIARVCYADGERRYVLAPKDLKVGDSFIVSENAPIKVGNRLPLGKLPTGTFVYNIELKTGAGARIARSAGNYAEVVAHDAGFAQIKLPSTEIRKVSDNAWASIGAVTNENSRLVKFGKAGRSRWMGIRPTVRGTAMNPVDHPHGGGEGRQGRGLRRAKSMWGKPTGKGQKTRTPKKYSNVFIVSRRKVGKKNKG